MNSSISFAVSYTPEETADFSYRDIKFLSDVKIDETTSALSSFKYLNLSNNQITTLENNFFEMFQGALYLDISNNRITKIESVQNLPKLQIFDFSKNEVSLIEDFENCKETLERIIAYKNNIIAVKFKAQMDKLTYLDIRHNQINKISFGNLVPHLKTLKVDNNLLVNINELSLFPELEVFSAADNGILEFPKLTNQNSLRTINLANNKIETLKNLHQTKLLTLDVSSNPINNNGLNCGIQQINSLQHLYISNTNLTRCLSISTLFPNLTTIDLRSTKINDLNDFISFLSQMKNLKVLDVRFTPLTLDLYPNKDLLTSAQSFLDNNSSSIQDDQIQPYESIEVYNSKYPKNSNERIQFRNQILNNAVSKLQTLDHIKISGKELDLIKKNQAADDVELNNSSFAQTRSKTQISGDNLNSIQIPSPSNQKSLHFAQSPIRSNQNTSFDLNTSGINNQSISNSIQLNSPNKSAFQQTNLNPKTHQSSILNNSIQPVNNYQNSFQNASNYQNQNASNIQDQNTSNYQNQNASNIQDSNIDNDSIKNGSILSDFNLASSEDNGTTLQYPNMETNFRLNNNKILDILDAMIKQEYEEDEEDEYEDDIMNNTHIIKHSLDRKNTSNLHRNFEQLNRSILKERDSILKEKKKRHDEKVKKIEKLKKENKVLVKEIEKIKMKQKTSQNETEEFSSSVTKHSFSRISMNSPQHKSNSPRKRNNSPSEDQKAISDSQKHSSSKAKLSSNHLPSKTKLSSKNSSIKSSLKGSAKSDDSYSTNHSNPNDSSSSSKQSRPKSSSPRKQSRLSSSKHIPNQKNASASSTESSSQHSKQNQSSIKQSSVRPIIDDNIDIEHTKNLIQNSPRQAGYPHVFELIDGLLAENKQCNGHISQAIQRAAHSTPISPKRIHSDSNQLKCDSSNSIKQSKDPSNHSSKPKVNSASKIDLVNHSSKQQVHSTSKVILDSQKEIRPISQNEPRKLSKYVMFLTDEGRNIHLPEVTREYAEYKLIEFFRSPVYIKLKENSEEIQFLLLWLIKGLPLTPSTNFPDININQSDITLSRYKIAVKAIEKNRDFNRFIEAGRQLKDLQLVMMFNFSSEVQVDTLNLLFDFKSDEVPHSVEFFKSLKYFFKGMPETICVTICACDMGITRNMLNLNARPTPLKLEQIESKGFNSVSYEKNGLQHIIVFDKTRVIPLYTLLINTS